MKLFNFLILFFLSFLLSSCYLDAVEDNSNYKEEIVLSLVNQAPVGFAGSGYYLRARIYLAEDADAMESQGTIWIDKIETQAIDYNPAELSTPLNTQAFFLGAQPPPNGIVILVDLPQDEYRVLLERLEYWEGDGESNPYAAGLTETFDVVAGSNTNISIEMLTHLSNT